MLSPTNRKKSSKLTVRALCLAALFVLSWLEWMVPLGVPGVKFGFSNLVILVFLSLFGFWEALLMTGLKILLSAFLFQGFSSFLFTMAGSVASCISMATLMPLYRKEKVSLAGVSAVGGFFHISLQYLMSTMVLKTTAVFGLYPVATALTLFTSVIIGYLAELLTKQLSKIR